MQTERRTDEGGDVRLRLRILVDAGRKPATEHGQPNQAAARHFHVIHSRCVLIYCSQRLRIG
jgi:hypothetical protein